METLKTLRDKYQEYVENPMNLNISRGIPSKEQLALSQELLNIDLSDDILTEDGVDIRNYGSLLGIKEARVLFAELFDISIDEVMVGGNSSLQLMYNVLDHFTYHQSAPWINDQERAFLCPVPGYDRHWDMLDHFGFKMIQVPLTGDGPDMDMVEDLVKNDSSIKGIFCVPKYSNPTGEVYSEETIERLANLETASDDFKILWDNAYIVHHLTHELIEISNILEKCKKVNYPDRVVMFTSTSKMTFPGSGVAAIGTSTKNLSNLMKSFSKQMISFDKVNQKRLVHFLKDEETMLRHMAKHGAIIKPKFEYILDTLDKEFKDNKIITWSRPKGGYFIHLTTKNGCASSIVSKLKDIGVILTTANATYPKAFNEKDNSIRLAPTFATMDELKKALEAIILCIKMVTLDNKKENA